MEKFQDREVLKPIRHDVQGKRYNQSSGRQYRGHMVDICHAPFFTWTSSFIHRSVCMAGWSQYFNIFDGSHPGITRFTIPNGVPIWRIWRKEESESEWCKDETGSFLLLSGWQWDQWRRGDRSVSLTLHWYYIDTNHLTLILSILCATNSNRPFVKIAMAITVKEALLL